MKKSCFPAESLSPSTSVSSGSRLVYAVRMADSHSAELLTTPRSGELLLRNTSLNTHPTLLSLWSLPSGVNSFSFSHLLFLLFSFFFFLLFPHSLTSMHQCWNSIKKRGASFPHRSQSLFIQSGCLGFSRGLLFASPLNHNLDALLLLNVLARPCGIILQPRNDFLMWACRGLT